MSADPVPVADPEDARLAPFRLLREPAALASAGLLAAEGRLVIERLLGPVSRFRARGLLGTPRALAALRPRLAAAGEGVPCYAATEALIQAVVGHGLHRGCVALAERGAPSGTGQVVALARAAGRPLLVLENVADPDNVGSLFRNAAAFGAGGVLLSPGGGDPLYRKALRASMGATLEVPFARAGAWPGVLRDVSSAGFRLVALAPGARLAIDALAAGPLSALLVGSEGDGLSAAALAAADLAVRIPIEPRVDSLNVATAAAIALHRLAPRSAGAPCGS
jgi:tRNA G18 (ribose-2'-O)-methylase SpoU